MQTAAKLNITLELYLSDTNNVFKIVSLTAHKIIGVNKIYCSREKQNKMFLKPRQSFVLQVQECTL